jgi:hypothetical protein
VGIAHHLVIEKVQDMNIAIAFILPVKAKLGVEAIAFMVLRRGDVSGRLRLNAFS